MFNFNHLFYFYTVARFGGMIKAAKHLRIAQPSLSTQIKALEAHTGRSLFKKVGRGLALTRDGEILNSICKKMFEPLEDLNDFQQNRESRIKKSIRIGVADELERPFVVNLIRRIFRKDLMNQNMQVSMKSDKHRLLLEQLRWRELDVLLSNFAAHGEDFAVLSEIAMPIVAVAAPAVVKSHKQQSRETLARTIAQMNVGLVLPIEDQKLRIESEIFMQKTRIRQPMVFESDILSAVVRATVEGLGIAFLPKPYIQKELSSGSLVKLNEGQTLWNHSIYQIVSKKRQLDVVNSDIRDYFRLYKEKS